MALLTCKNLCIGYEGMTVAQNIDFEVNQGDYLCIIGENGSGKSTLMKNLLHLLKPISGEIILSEEIKDDEIGYLPQQTAIQKNFPASVYEIVLSGCQNKLGFFPFYKKEHKDLALQNMQKMNITHLKNRCYRELSGGQQQRVLLARALCAAEKLILLDEPVTGLDPDATQEMYELIHNLNQKDKIAVIMISHDIDAVNKYATHILKFSNKVEFSKCQK